MIPLRPTTRLIPTSSVSEVLQHAILEAMEAGGLEQVMISRPDGLPIAHNLADPALARRLAAMSAAIVGTGEMATSELDRGSTRGVTIDATDTRIVCLHAGEEAIVTGLADPNANVGMMLLVLRHLADTVRDAIERWENENPEG